MSLTLDDVVQGRVKPSPNYSSRGGKKVRLLIFHTAEGSRNNASLGSWFAQKASKASSHVGIDDSSVVRFVPEVYSAWTARSANPVASQAELCGFAKWGANDWGAHPAMLEQAARWLAAASAYHSIPLVRIRESQTKIGTGVCQHIDITRGWRDGSHSDCGTYFSDHVLDGIIARAKVLSGQPNTQPVTRPEAARSTEVYVPKTLPTLRCDGKESGWGWLVQECLQRAGHSLVRDGKPGAGSAAQLKRYQSARGLAADAVVGGWTWASFIKDAADPVRRGSAGGHPGIEVLQNYLGVTLDRDYGAASVARMQAVQRWGGLADDGEVGAASRQLLAARPR